MMEWTRTAAEVSWRDKLPLTSGWAQTVINAIAGLQTFPDTGLVRAESHFCRTTTANLAELAEFEDRSPLDATAPGGREMAAVVLEHPT